MGVEKIMTLKLLTTLDVLETFFQDLKEFITFLEYYKNTRECKEIQRRQREDLEPKPTGEDPIVEETLPMSLGLSITQLWNDPSVKQVYGLSNQFQLNETAE